MKKIIISILTLALGFSFFATSAFAASQFNSPAAMPTITVVNATTGQCFEGPIDGCWKTNANASPGDVIAVHVFYDNTSNETATQTTLSIQPSRSGTQVTFNGGVASTSGPRSTGTAYVTLSQTTTITYMDASDSLGTSISASSLLGSSGVNIGDVAPGDSGWLVAHFRVNGPTVVTPPPSNSACVINDFHANPQAINLGGTSNLIWTTSNCDYVNISPINATKLGTDNSGYLVTPTNTTTYTLTAYPGGATATATVTVNNNNGGGNNNSCTINNFNANPSSVTAGNLSTLNWNTTNCSYVTISGSGQLPSNGNQPVYPYNTTTYTLTAYPGGQTSTTTVNVNGNNNNYCSINSFYVDSNNLSQGQTTILHWNTSGTNGVYISGFGNENSSGSIPISPYQSTTYTLTLNGGNCNGNASRSVYVTVGQQINPVYPVQTQPQAITTVANALSGYSAQLNGIAVPNVSYGTTNAWFEYGPTTSLGNRSNNQNVNGFGTYPYSATISGLVPGQTYFYRAAVQNQNGIAYGSVVPFNTPSVASTSTYTPPTRVIVQTRTVTANNGITVKSQASLFKLEVDSSFDHMCIGGDIDYTVNYQNISSQNLQNSILRITFPGELTYASSSQGDYDVTDRTLTISLGTVQAGEQGSVTVHAQVNNQAVQGKLAVITATMVYTNPTTLAQENAIAYSLITISNDCPSVLGASVFGFGSFLPQTLLAWLLLILVILALIVLARSLTKKKEEPAKTM